MCGKPSLRSIHFCNLHRNRSILSKVSLLGRYYFVYPAGAARARARISPRPSQPLSVVVTRVAASPQGPGFDPRLPHSLFLLTCDIPTSCTGYQRLPMANRMLLKAPDHGDVRISDRACHEVATLQAFGWRGAQRVSWVERLHGALRQTILPTSMPYGGGICAVASPLPTPIPLTNFPCLWDGIPCTCDHASNPSTASIKAKAPQWLK